MKFASEYDGFEGKRDVPPGIEECQMWSARWARGVVMVMEECRMTLRGTNPGQRPQTEIEERLAS
jgi:hypothetical protein